MSHDANKFYGSIVDEFKIVQLHYLSISQVLFTYATVIFNSKFRVISICPISWLALR